MIDPSFSKDVLGRDDVFDYLTSTYNDLKERWESYKKTEYRDYQLERLDYVDIGEIISYLIGKIKTTQTDSFDDFFERVELIMQKGDDYAVNLIIIGLLEGLQNTCGWEKIDYYKGFDKWLNPNTKASWNQLIHFWESEESKQMWERIKKDNSE